MCVLMKSTGQRPSMLNNDANDVLLGIWICMFFFVSFTTVIQGSNFRIKRTKLNKFAHGRYTYLFPINMVTDSHIGQSKSITLVSSIAMGGFTTKYCQSNYYINWIKLNQIRKINYRRNKNVDHYLIPIFCFLAD